MSGITSALQLAAGYIPYWINATNRHGLQAPFAFSFYEAVLRRDRLEPQQERIETLRRELLKDHSRIDVRDFGAGFGGVVYRERSVSYITRNSAKPRRYARMLYRLTQHLQPALCLELGTSFGLSSLYMVAGFPSARIETLEGCGNTAAMALKNFSRFPEYSIQIHQGDFKTVLPILLPSLTRPVDLLFLDGHHQYEATLAYFEQCLPFLSESAVVIVDDIRWSDGMRKAWKELCMHPKVKMSMDIYLMGFLFLDPGLSPGHFPVRY